MTRAGQAHRAERSGGSRTDDGDVHGPHPSSRDASAVARGYPPIVESMALPGSELIERGVHDLERGVESIPALLVAIGAPRLRRLGLRLPTARIDSPERRLYDALAVRDPDSAHSRYNALVRRLVSFERAAECAGR